MKICESWLRDWVKYTLSLDELNHQLTLAGLEFEGCYPVAGEFEKVVVAHVLETKRHPQADKLSVCVVDAGLEAPLQIVCGASNVRPGLKVALAMIGARLPQDLQIKACKLRGEASQGMLCSTVELGLEDKSDGILELPHDAPIGKDLREYLVLNDAILEIDLTPNRADCFSVLGVAREVAALNSVVCQSIPDVMIAPRIADKLEVILDKPAACPHYAGRVIRGIQAHAETPIWLQERLRRSGLRSVHPVVDVLNYVMLEIGQPMHAFDLQSISGGIVVRESRQQESLTLLDGQTVTLDAGTLVIADAEKPLAIAGIMGGAHSAVHVNTVDIFLESAFFAPQNMAGVARRFGLATDASQRFERGVDPSIQCKALEYATALIQQIVGGDAGPIQVKIYTEHLPVNPAILFRPARVERLTGVTIGPQEMFGILERLGMSVTQEEKHWTVIAPTYRFDIQNEADIVEEILRIYGYDKITAQPVLTEMQAGTINQLDQLTHVISSFLVNRGYREAINYSFVDPEIQKALYPQHSAHTLLNPISSDLSQMRTGLWSGLIAAMMHNLHRQQTALKLFEAGIVFQRLDNELQEIPCIAALIAGDHGQMSWNEQSRAYDFYDLKGDLQALLLQLGQESIVFKKATHPALHPGKSAEIMYDERSIGWIGALHPGLMDALDITTDVFLFELSLSPLLNASQKTYKPISRYPQTRRDLSLIIDESVTVGQIEALVRDVVDTGCLKAFDIFDVYYGEAIPKGKKSLAIALTLQSDNRTLVDAEIQSMVNDILQKLEGTFSAVLRAV